MLSMSPRLRRSTHFTGLAVLCASALATTAVRAADAPTWTFTVGAANRYRTTQNIIVTMDLGAGGEQTHDIKNVIDLAWTVAEVKPDGSAVLKQKVTRSRLKITNGAVVDFDSASTDEPQGFAAIIAPMLRELARSEFTVTMTPRGEITDVEVPTALVNALTTSPGAQVMGSLATADGLKAMVRAASLELPETLEPGVEWSAVAEAENPVLGKQTITTTYRYAGPKDVKGVAFEAFTPRLEIAFAGGPWQVNVTKQESTGEVLFNRDAGRLESIDLHHTLDMTMTSAGKSLKQSMEQRMTMEWLPPDAE